MAVLFSTWNLKNKCYLSFFIMVIFALPDLGKAEVNSAVEDTSAVGTDPHKGSDEWFSPDKLDHFVVSALLTGSSYMFIRSFSEGSENRVVLLSTSFSFGTGIAKEIYDLTSGKGTASAKDLFWDAAGVSCIILFIKLL